MQWEIVLFTASLVCLCVIERLINVILILFSTHVLSTKDASAKQVLVSNATSITTIITTVLQVVVKSVMYLMSWWLLIMMVFVFFSVVYVSYEETPKVWIAMMKFYNANVGPWIGQVIIVPLYILDLLIKALLPFWNAFVWFWKTMLAQGFLPMLIDQIKLVFQITEALVEMIQHVVEGLVAFVETFDCDASASCLTNDVQIVNVISPMGSLRQAVAVSLELAKKFCSYTAIPFDLIFYPILDINLAQGLHHLVNSVLHAVLVIPYQTYVRCAISPDTSFKVMMCTPDVTPFFQFLAAGITSIGMLVDNWMNIALVIVQQAITGESPVCDKIGDTLIDDLVLTGNSAGLFQGNPTTVVGLTNWMYAVTDGHKVLYKGHSGLQSQITDFPYDVNIDYGVAAVSYLRENNLDVSAMSDGSTSNSLQTTSLFGCTCVDGGSGISVTCSVLPMNGWIGVGLRPEFQSNVIFPDTWTTADLTCSMMDIHVKSIRWSFHRYSSNLVQYGIAETSLPTTDCITKGNCREVDAAIWIVPRCGQDTGGSARICQLTSSCFPYCMGVRLSGSKNNNILLASASNWKKGKTLINRDCNIYDSTIDNAVYLGLVGSSTVAASGTIYGTDQPTNVYVQSVSRGIDPVCYPVDFVTSTVPLDPSKYSTFNTYSKMQPFVVAGDVLFTEKDIGGGLSTIVVERLESDEKNSFFLSKLNQDFPTEQRMNVPLNEQEFLNQDRVLLPYSTRITKSQAVSTRNFIFYASNPDYNVFEAYFEYCSRKNGDLGKFGLLIQSSYGPLRIYRVRAFAKCTEYSCGAGLVKSIDFDGFKSSYPSSCRGELNTSIVQMEYMNEDNVIVVVESGMVNKYNIKTNKFTQTTRQVYWLNPATMQISKTIWQTTVPNSNFGVLCPGMQRLPRLGSFVSELVNSAVYLVQYIVGLPLYFPGMVKIWKDGGGRCPLNSYQHSYLANCGKDILSLEPFFDSLTDASSIFWHSLSTISYFILKANDNEYTPINQIIDGMASYGEGTIDLYAAGNAVVTLTNAPIKQQIQDLWASISTDGSLPSGLKNVQGNMIIWARFTYHVLSEIILLIVKSVLASDYLSSADIWHKVWNVLFESKEYYTNTITATNRLGCSGIRLMFGNDNPWAKVAYYQCTATSGFIDNMLDVMLDVNIYIPMTVCVCKDSARSDPKKFAQEHCTQYLPSKLKPTLYTLVNTMVYGAASSQSFCQSVLEFTRQKVLHGFDPWFMNMDLALTALSESIDYTLIVFDAKAGQCWNFQSDAHVVSIVPQPIDYFQKCSKTSLCKTKCSSEWLLFQEYKTIPIEMNPVDVQVESMFFPGQYDETLIVNNVTAVVEVDSSLHCTIHPSRQDYALAIAEYAAYRITIRKWCIPQSPGSTLYVSKTTPAIVSTTIPGEIMECYFKDTLGDVVYLLLRVVDRNQVWMITATGAVVNTMHNVAYTLPTGMQLIDTIHIWPVLNTIVVDVITKTMEERVDPSLGVTFTAESHVLHYYWNSNNQWVYTDKIELNMFGGSYMLTKINNDAYSYLMVPSESFLPLYVLQITKTGSQITYVKEVVSTTLSTELMFFNNKIISSVSLSPQTVFIVSNHGWNWLQQVRMDQTLKIQAVKNSVPVTVKVFPQGNCDEQSCEGCLNITTQRMCHAYNKCALMRCVGTLVNQKRPLCALGQTLSFQGTEALQMMQGAWSVLAEMLAMTLKLSLSPGTSLDIVWPEDVFMGFVCNSKDKMTEFFAILTSTLNGLMGAYKKVVTRKSKLDTNADASVTITSTSLNSFLSQITLWPLYKMIAIEQILLCQVNGLLAVVDLSGYQIRLKSPDLVNSSSIIAGACLTLSSGVASQTYTTNKNNSNTSSNQQTAHTAAALVSDAVRFIQISMMAPYIHFMDAIMTYFIGIIRSLAILVMSQYTEKCNPPNYYYNETITCACDDYRLSVPTSRASEGMSHFPLWCTGTLGMLDTNNDPIVVYNPFTYEELRQKAWALQSFVDCLSRSYQCDQYEPNDPIFIRQGVSLVNVLIKCRENFMKKQWDAKAHVYFDRDLRSMLSSAGVSYTAPTGLIPSCLMDSHKQGSGVEYCQNLYISALGLDSTEVYWAYSRAQYETPEFTDSCLVFSGPGLVRNLVEFQACVDGGEMVSAGCTLNPTIWSVTSFNDVPVAETHIVLYQGTHLDGIIQRYYRDAHELVMSAITEALNVWGNESNPDVDVEFFSTEGDVIHQVLDCIFMGPYSRVDYWPIPQKMGRLEELKGPRWYRDTSEGMSRNIDVDTCAVEPSMPFTCGSAARRSVVRYFIKTILVAGRRNNNNKTLIQQIVLSQLRELYDDWADSTTYGCQCLDSMGYSPLCCFDDNETNWVPSHLQRPFHDIKSDHVLQALESEYDTLYNETMQNPMAWLQNNNERGQYDWSGSTRAKDEASFDTTVPVLNYTNTLDFEIVYSDLWGLCHGSLKQVFFTLPVYNNNVARLEKILLYNGDPASTKALMEEIVREAMLHSPTYRHYYPRYHPSPSLMCVNDTIDSDYSMGMSYFDDFKQKQLPMVSSNSILPDGLPTWKHTQFSLGRRSCFCGWELRIISDVSYCVIPSMLDTCTKICSDIIPCESGCKYKLDIYDNLWHNGSIQFNPDWFCPHFELSPHWGLLDLEQQSRWMGGENLDVTLSSRDLLKYGRSGLRLGNLDFIKKNSKQTIHSHAREVPLENGHIRTCQYDQLSKTAGINPVHLAEELFPIAHGVGEGGVSSYCLRYLIEKARFQVLHNLFVNQTKPPAYADQQELVNVWSRKCGNQLYLLHLCTNLNVFRPAVASNTKQLDCHYLQIENSPGFYTTAECLVFLNGEFYDPCRCMTCDAFAPIKLNSTYLQNTPQCKLRFNPIGKATKPQAPIGYWNGEFVDYIDLLHGELASYLLDDPDAVGNTPNGKSWQTSEGFMSTEGDECDMMVDYWPDDMDYPVGYHPTTVCEEADNAYRTFMNVFSYEKDFFQNPMFKYQHDLLRDAEDIDTLFGVGGLCRQTNFGMNMYEINTMRYCTRLVHDETVDFSIPGSSHIPNNTFSDEKCTRSNRELPWDRLIDETVLYSSVLFSIGTIPNIPNELSEFYPETPGVESMYHVGSKIMEDEQWSDYCYDYPLTYCQGTGFTCPSGYTCRGRKCQLNPDLDCTSNLDCANGGGICLGVCVDSSVQCIRHSDCTTSSNPLLRTFMCTGRGKCVQPQIIVMNEHLSNPISYSMQTLGQCTGGSYSLIGGSYWGYMGSDLLRIHGMCSYSDWYTYKEFYKPACTGSIDGDTNACWVDPKTTKLINLAIPLGNNSNFWWGDVNKGRPSVMFVRPTICDRDYERMENFTMCQPLAGDISFTTSLGTTSTPLTYETFTRAYSQEGISNIPVANLDTTSATSFLYGPGVFQNTFDPTKENPLRSCSTMRQCSASPFTRNFVTIDRTYREPVTNNLVPYNKQHNFICGAIGYVYGARCRLDIQLFPLYGILCKTQNFGESCRSLIAPSTLIDYCGQITDEYDANYDAIVRIVNGLRNLFYIFDNIQLEDDFLLMGACATRLYSEMSKTTNTPYVYYTKTLYYPFPFIVKEFPFDWYYQCILLGNFASINPSMLGDQSCVAYLRKKQGNPEDKSANFIEYVKMNRVGFTKNSVDIWVQNMLQNGTTKLAWIRKSVQAMYYTTTKGDYSYPSCVTQRQWINDDSTTIPEKMLIVNSYSSNNCQGNWESRLFHIINGNRNYQQPTSIEASEFLTSCVSVVRTARLNFANWMCALSATSLPEAENSTLLYSPIPRKTMLDVLEEDILAGWDYTYEPDRKAYIYHYHFVAQKELDDLPIELWPEPDETTDRTTSNNIDENKPFSLCPASPENKKEFYCNVIPPVALLGKFDCKYFFLTPFAGNELNTQNATSVYNHFRRVYEDKYVIPNMNILEAVEFQFFTDTKLQKDFTMDFALENEYIGNNQPDTTKSVMCTITNTKLIDYNSCNHPHWISLKRHAEKYYTKPGAILLSPQTQLNWKVTNQLFFAGFVSSFRSQNKTPSSIYLKSLFDSNVACKQNQEDQWKEKICYRVVNGIQETIGVINPWLHGYYNPYSRCDVSFRDINANSFEYIDSNTLNENGEFVVPPDMPLKTQCNLARGQNVPTPGPSRYSTDPLKVKENSAYNLCTQQLVESLECEHDESLLGGDDGLPVGSPVSDYNMYFQTKYTTEQANYKVGENMYVKSSIPIPDDFHQGLFGGTNPLWSGEEGPTGFLKVPPYEIGIHKIGLTILPPNATAGETLSTFVVTHLPLADQSNEENMLLGRYSTRKVTEWVGSLLPNIRADDLRFSGLYQARVRGPSLYDASCPLKRYSFYGRAAASFNPVLPDPLRAKFMFGRFLSNMYAHPTMEHSTNGAFFGKYKTVNGFCFCPLVQGVIQRQCQIRFDTSGQCSLDETIRALKANEGEWFQSYVFPPVDANGNPKPCTMQLDWPFIPNPMRDGTTYREVWTDIWSKASDPISQQCHVLDRFASFMYRYKNTGIIQPTPGKNTISHGVCKTGRATTTDNYAPPVKSRCAKVHLDYSTSQHVCDTSYQKSTFQRRSRISEVNMFNKYRNTKRTKCNTCSKPPPFVDGKNRLIPPESSFGIPYKVSASRMLGEDLKQLLIDNNVTQLINAAAWEPSQFIRNYLLQPHMLFYNVSPTTITSSTTSNANWKQDDSARWTEKPWVYCPDVPSLRDSQTCKGTISRAQWVSSKTSVCPAQVRFLQKQGNQDPMSRASFANIDKYTNKVAMAIQQARQLINQSNCMAAGKSNCLPRPFTYHPASFVVTNQAWIRDTVIDYYQTVNPEACVFSHSRQALLSYLTSKQNECPANSLFLFEQILRIVRVIITEVALLVSHIASLAIKLFASIFSPSAKKEFKSEWAAVKAQYEAFIDLVSDMVLDALMNSGALGQRLMRFISKSCAILNDIMNKGMNIWCTFMTIYLRNALTGLLHFVALAESGFQLVQDFIEDMFRSFLPLSFVSKYAGSAAMNYMTNKAAESSDKSDRNKKSQSSTRPKSRNAKKTGFNLNKAGKGAAANGGGRAAVAITVLLIAQEMMDEVQKEGMLDSMWPSNKDLFDFISVIDQVDNVIYWIDSEERCKDYLWISKYTNESWGLTCPTFQLDPDKEDDPAKSISATLCWAASNPAYGQSSAFSCTISSTCCPTPYDCPEDKSLNVLCNDCPNPSTAGIARFSCDNMQCKCGVPIQIISSCSSNGRCDSTSQCMLVSMFSSVSYGTIECKNCPGKLICLVETIGTTGKCACLLDRNVYMATCFEPAGLVTYPHANDLCGFLPSLTETSTRSTFQYSDLMIIECSIAVRSICANVYMDNGYTVMMPVSLSVGVSRRRLLLSTVKGNAQPPTKLIDDQEQDNQFVFPAQQVYTYESEYDMLDENDVDTILHWPGWNETAAPCNLLATAYQQRKHLGILETHELYKCVYWRSMGRKVIQEFSLTSLNESDTFLLSLDDLAYAMMKRHVVVQLFSNPRIWFRIFLMHPFLKPVRAFVLMMANRAEEVFTPNITEYYWTSQYAKFQQKNRTTAKSNKKKTEKAIDRIPGYIKKIEKFFEEPTIPVVKTKFTNQSTTVYKKAQYNKRKLLSVMSDIQAVKEFSANTLLQSNSNSPQLNLVASQSWIRGPYSWPLHFTYSMSECMILRISQQVSMQVLMVTVKYFRNFNAVKPDIPRTFRENLPRTNVWPAKTYVNTTTNQTYYLNANQTYKNIYSYVFYKTLDLVSITPNDLIYFLSGDSKWTLTWFVQSSLQCDFGSVMSCSKHTRDLFMSSVVFVLLYFLVYFVSSSLGVPSLATYFILAYPFFILWYTYGISPNCLPMLPTCLLDDVISLIQRVLPVSIKLPDELYCPASGDNSTRIYTCLQSCENLGFTYWLDPLAYTLCSLDKGNCKWLVDQMQIPINYSNSTLLSISVHNNISVDIPMTSLSFIQPLRPSFQKSFTILFNTNYTQGSTLPDAYGWCAFIQWVQSIPFLIMLMILATVAVSMVSAVIGFLPLLVNLISQILVFNHTK